MLINWSIYNSKLSKTMEIYLILLFNLIFITQIMANKFNISQSSLENCQELHVSGYAYKQFFPLDSLQQESHIVNGIEYLLNMNLFVKASSDAHIMLSPYSYKKMNAKVYEFALGTNENTRCALYLKPLELVKPAKHLVPCDMFDGSEIVPLTLQMTKSGNLTVSITGNTPFLWHYGPLPIKYISFSSWSFIEVKYYFDCKAPSTPSPTITYSATVPTYSAQKTESSAPELEPESELVFFVTVPSYSAPEPLMLASTPTNLAPTTVDPPIPISLTLAPPAEPEVSTASGITSDSQPNTQSYDLRSYDGLFESSSESLSSSQSDNLPYESTSSPPSFLTEDPYDNSPESTSNGSYEDTFSQTNGPPNSSSEDQRNSQLNGPFDSLSDDPLNSSAENLSNDIFNDSSEDTSSRQVNDLIDSLSDSPSKDEPDSNTSNDESIKTVSVNFNLTSVDFIPEKSYMISRGRFEMTWTDKQLIQDDRKYNEMLIYRDTPLFEQMWKPHARFTNTMNEHSDSDLTLNSLSVSSNGSVYAKYDESILFTRCLHSYPVQTANCSIYLNLDNVLHTQLNLADKSGSILKQKTQKHEWNVNDVNELTMKVESSSDGSQGTFLEVRVNFQRNTLDKTIIIPIIIDTSNIGKNDQ